LIALPSILFAHFLCFLLSQWSVSIKCLLGYYAVADINSTQYIHVKTTKNFGKERIVPLYRENLIQDISIDHINIAGTNYNVFPVYFEFQKMKFDYDFKSNTFYPLAYPSKGKVSDYLKCNGHQIPTVLNLALKKWNRNEYDIPLPSFLELYSVRLFILVFNL